MPKNIKTRTTNGLDNFDISTQTGNTHTNIAFVKTIISVSANYTKDAILQSTLCEHNNSTTNNEIDFLNNFDRFPSLNQQKKLHIPPPEIKTDKIIYCFENTVEPFVELKANASQQKKTKKYADNLANHQIIIPKNINLFAKYLVS